MPQLRLPTERAFRRGFPFVFFLLACLSFSPSLLALSLPSRLSFLLVAQKPSALSKTKEQWMGIYLDKQKIGYSRIRILPTTYKGQPALRTTSHSKMRLTLLGANVEQEENTATVTDAQYRPLNQVISVQSNGSALHIEADYDYAARKINCAIGIEPNKTQKIVSIPEGANLTGDTNLLTEGRKLAVGQKLVFHYLDPLTVELQPITVEIAGQETVLDSVSGRQVRAFVVKAGMTMGQMTTWESEDGDTLKGEIDLGVVRLMMKKESREVAENLTAGKPTGTGKGERYTPPADFAIATAIAPDKPIDNPRALRSLRVTLSGVPNERLLLSDARQKVERLPNQNGAGLTARMTIKAAEFDAEQAANLPVTDSALHSYLKKAAYLETDNAGIQETAEKLRGDETNLYRIAVAVRNWVAQNMTPDASIGVPRAAADIFARRRGVCRDYATLYAALARAAGVPTRLCAGIVYADGKFFYHAWAESFVGEWVAFDPTLYNPKQPVEYVDATHIKFAQGDVTQMFNVVAIIGKLKIVVN